MNLRALVVSLFVVLVSADVMAQAIQGASDSQGNVYVVGSSSENAPDSSINWTVRKSSDRGNTWSTVDFFTSPDGYVDVGGIAVTPQDQIFVVGDYWSLPVGAKWMVRMSSDHGATWTTSDLFTCDDAGGEALSVISDSKGAVYVAGWCYTDPNSMNQGRQVVRKSTDGGVTWQVVDDFLFQNNGYIPTSYHALAKDALDNIYVAGKSCCAASGGNHAIVRKGPYDGGVWSTVHDFQSGLDDTKGLSVTVDGQGRIFSTSMDIINNTTIKIMLHKSENGGSTWTKVTELPKVNYQSIFASSGNALFMNGWYSGATSFFQSVLRSVDNGVTWQSVVDDQDDYGSGLFQSGTDHSLYAIGGRKKVSNDPNYRYYLSWQVKRSTDGGSTWTTVDDFTPPFIVPNH